MYECFKQFVDLDHCIVNKKNPHIINFWNRIFDMLVDFAFRLSVGIEHLQLFANRGLQCIN